MPCCSYDVRLMHDVRLMTCTMCIMHVCGLYFYIGQSGWLTCLCLVCRYGFSLCYARAAVSFSPFLLKSPAALCLLRRTWSMMKRSSFVIQMPQPPIDLLLVPRPPRLARWWPYSDDEAPIPRSALISCDSEDDVRFPCPMLSCLPSNSDVNLNRLPLSVPLVGYDLPHRLVVVANPSCVWFMSICFFFFHFFNVCSSYRQIDTLCTGWPLATR
jgi:hypothetical protein